MTDNPGGGLLGSVRRLFPYARPILPFWILGLTMAGLASLVGLAIPQVLQRIVNGSLGSPDGSALWWGVGVVAGLGVLEAALITARRRFVLTPSTRLESTLRVRLYEHLLDLPPAFHDHWPGGQLLARSIGDIRVFRRWLSFGAIMLMVNTLTIAVGIALMVSVSWPLAVIFAVFTIPAFVVSVRSRARLRGLSRRSQDQSGDLSALIEESVHGIRVLKAFGRELEALADFSEQAEDLRDTELGKARERALVTLVMTSLPEVALAASLVVGAFQFAAGNLTTGGLLAFFATAAIVSGPLERLSEQFMMSVQAKTAIDRYLEVLDIENELTDPDDPIAVPEGSGRVELRNVVFAYHPTGSPVLDGVELVLEPGETLALVGLTGSGKSTIAQLIPRLYDVSAGAVEIDGVDVRRLTRQQLRGLVGVAFEEPVLFSASVRENVALGRPDAHEAAIREALEVAHADFVDGLPDGLDTVIGEEGLSLSGGQRQRLSLARAILGRPRVLVLDDPLSALDVRTEARVTERLREYLAGTTTLVVAHRPSTVALGDRVAVVHDGRIAAVGEHRALLATNPLYRSIITTHDPELETAR
ncbi:ABC transporter ATP-binding protein [Protaetiibacter larvae]|uniref:ABC transporter ATP-binding protein n=1 Tax=Protaetiibacter larvae TaxID=2592654 RepID=A0A5C1Y6P2_9MICO|nr:ABC transporter ATP-binding protein [Protaetiibacter larvae]QEO09456.1 ABC transporter ATP-binding protein [Protaetiibacter larvae]